MITTANVNTGTRFGASVGIPFNVELITNDLQLTLRQTPESRQNPIERIASGFKFSRSSPRYSAVIEGL